jgi:hypothetical protein
LNVSAAHPLPQLHDSSELLLCPNGPNKNKAAEDPAAFKSSQFLSYHLVSAEPIGVTVFKSIPEISSISLFVSQSRAVVFSGFPKSAAVLKVIASIVSHIVTPFFVALVVAGIERCLSQLL